MEYQEFLDAKSIRQMIFGKEVDKDDIHPSLFPFQRDVTHWAIRRGRCAIFLDTGLGKTRCALEWARLLGEKTITIAPLSVARQSVREAKAIGIDLRYVRSQSVVNGDTQQWITNYDMVDHFDMSKFGAVVLDESSLLKSIAGKTRKKLTEMCKDVPFRLCCTATPAPNDYIELGNHAGFLGVSTRAEMLAMFFINANREHYIEYGGRTYRKKGRNDGGQEWRLKHHAEQPFFRWLASWAITMTKPSDLGYSDDGFVLPPLNVHLHTVDVGTDFVPEGQLFFTSLKGITHRAQIRKQTLSQRVEKLAELVNGCNDQWIVWTGLDAESREAAAVLDDTVEVKGSHSPDYKAQAFEDFQDGKFRVLVSKPRIGGFGMNFQNAHKMAFLGLNDSFEMYYQSVRRQWRYLQEHPVDVHIIISDIETEVYDNVMRKETQANVLRQKLIEQIADYEKEELGMVVSLVSEYTEDIVKGEMWTAMLGDACIRLKELDDDSIDLSVYSPPFADLFTYSASSRDLGNSRGWDEFFEHYQFIIREILRVTKAGRLTCVHSSDIPALAQTDGYIGIKDFPGRVVEAYQRGGWIFHGRAVISKNPQAMAIRTHSKGLAFGQMHKDSTWSRPALIDHILIFRKDGDNEVPVTPVINGEMDNDIWIEWANGVWTDITETNVLQHGHGHGRAEDDEKHVCPLQLETIERCVKLYSNPSELVLDPFAGIGSTGYEAIKYGRQFTGIELKRSYFDEMLHNLRKAEAKRTQVRLF